jgi:hypothetical protein
MKKILLLAALFITSCTVYTEKQSEAVSQNVYATNESLGKARVDLAYFYSNETTKFIKPPKRPIKISSVYEAEKVVGGAPNGGKTRVVLVPDAYKGDKVVVVGSADYQELLKDRETKKVLEQDNKNKELQLIANNKELTKQKEMQDKMVKDSNYYQKEVYKLRLKCLWLSITIVGLLVLIGGYIYMRMNRLFMF